MKRISLLQFFILILFSTGCATPKAYQSGRNGVIDDLNRPGGSRTSASRSRSVARSSEEQEPAHSEYHAASKNPGEVLDHSKRIASLKSQLSGWKWPLSDVLVTSTYGPRNGEFHEGIDLRAKVGTPVFSVDKGRVIYAGRRISGYGNMIIVRHPSGLASVYAHNSRLLVIEGQKVARGQRIATSGQSGRVRGPHVHFEVRDGVAALDPLKILPKGGGETEPKPALKPKTIAALRRSAKSN